MNKYWNILGCLVLLALFVPESAWAQQIWPRIDAPGPRDSAGSQDGALIVSIEDYADKPSMPSVTGARESGKDWHAWFTKSRGLKASRVTWLHDRQATRGSMLDELEKLSRAVGPKGNLWVVFIGHGAATKDGKEGILLGWAAQARNEKEFYGQSVAHSELEKAAKAGKPKQVVMVLDACFSGKSGAGNSLLVGKQPALLVGAPKVSTRVLMLTAAKKDEFAGQLPGVERPAFSYLVLGALRGWADDTSSGHGDGNGEITAQEVIAYANEALRSTALGSQQTPEVVGNADFVLASLKKSALERSPDFGDIQVALKEKGPAPREKSSSPSGSATAAVSAPKRVVASGGGSQMFNALIAAAEMQAADAQMSPADKEAAWRKVADYNIDGQHKARELAGEHAAYWKTIAEQRTGMKSDWTELFELLKMDGLAIDVKKGAVQEYLDKYQAHLVEEERKEAAKVLKMLEAGRDPAALPARYRRIQSGSFMMGSTQERGRYDELSLHEVYISKSFYIQTTPVTQGQWLDVMGSNPSYYKACGPNCPVEMVTWNDAAEYANALSEREGLQSCYINVYSERPIFNPSCRGYRLPTEAEWEYAARAGSTHEASYGDLDSIAWYHKNNQGRTHPVGQKKANDWLLYDMLGNVSEWTGDWYDEAYYGKSERVDPRGPSSGRERVTRGSSTSYIRRGRQLPHVAGRSTGFRVARTID